MLHNPIPERDHRQIQDVNESDFFNLLIMKNELYLF